jgi:ABC-type lipoprotein export system ATPase subunit
MLRELNRDRGQTIILVTHDPEVGAASDRVIRMRDGAIVQAELGAIQLPAARDVDAGVPELAFG